MVGDPHGSLGDIDVGEALIIMCSVTRPFFCPLVDL